MTPPRKDTGIFLHRLTPLVTSSSRIILAFHHSPSIDRSNVGFDRRGADHRDEGWVDRCHRAFYFVLSTRREIVPLCLENVKSRLEFLGTREGGWSVLLVSLGRVSKSGLRVYVYAHKKRWSEEGYVRMSGMGLWNRWMGDDDTASVRSFSVRDSSNDWFRERRLVLQGDDVSCDRSSGTRTSFNSRMRRNSRWHDVTCGWFGNMHGSRDDTSRRRKFENRPICDFRHRVHSERWVDRLNLEYSSPFRDRLSHLSKCQTLLSIVIIHFVYHRFDVSLDSFFFSLLLNFTISWPWADSI